MAYGESSELTEDQKKWAQWTMQPKKRKLKPTDYVSVLVITASVVVVTGIHHYMTF
ncbi:hypothetical protein [Ruegeria arenilitoris]|uniref:hypothetical protein n=1 Tax=Ruegeria arenilitoris TaxID=1173585 RepID=UPI00147C1E35|nr:hypothetical protein [Ruegeria arenilitoris]